MTLILPHDSEGLYNAEILKNLNPLEVVIVTEKQLMQQTENSIAAAENAIVEMKKNATKIQEMMESRTPKVIKRMFELSDSHEGAVELILSMGYTKEEIRDCGHDVD